MILDGRSPALSQTRLRVRPFRGVKERRCIYAVATDCEEQRQPSYGGVMDWEITYKCSSLGTTTVVPHCAPRWYNAFFSSFSEMPSAPRDVPYISNMHQVTSQSYDNGLNMSLRLLTMAHQYDWSPSAAFWYPSGPGGPKSAANVGGESAGGCNPLRSAR